jgi:hypothetical protein
MALFTFHCKYKRRIAMKQTKHKTVADRKLLHNYISIFKKITQNIGTS